MKEYDIIDKKESLLVPLTKENSGNKAPLIIIFGSEDTDKSIEKPLGDLELLVDKLKETEPTRAIYYLPDQGEETSVQKLSQKYEDEILKNPDINNSARFILFGGPSAALVVFEVTKRLEKKERNVSPIILGNDLNTLTLKNDEKYKLSSTIENLIIFSLEKEKHDNESLGWSDYTKEIQINNIKCGSYNTCLSNPLSAAQLAKSLSFEMTLIEMIEVLEIICYLIDASSTVLVGYTKSKGIESCFTELREPYLTALKNLQGIKKPKEKTDTAKEMKSPRTLPNLQELALNIWYVTLLIQANASQLGKFQSFIEPLYEDGDSRLLMINEGIEKICTLYKEFTDEYITKSSKPLKK